MVIKEIKRTVDFIDEETNEVKVLLEMEGIGSMEDLPNSRFILTHEGATDDVCEECGGVCGDCLACCGEECDDVTYLPTPKFGGAFYDEHCNFIYIEKVVYDKKKGTVAVIWNDGVCTKSTCDVRDTWNAELGLVLAVMKRMSSQEFVKNLLLDWSVPGFDSGIRSLKDVRRDKKKREKGINEVVVDEDTINVETKKTNRHTKESKFSF